MFRHALAMLWHSMPLYCPNFRYDAIFVNSNNFTISNFPFAILQFHFIKNLSIMFSTNIYVRMYVCMYVCIGAKHANKIKIICVDWINRLNCGSKEVNGGRWAWKCGGIPNRKQKHRYWYFVQGFYHHFQSNNYGCLRDICIIPRIEISHVCAVNLNWCTF